MIDLDFILVRAFFRMQHRVKVQALIPTLRFKKQHSFLLILFISGISPVGVPLIESTSASFLFQEILSIFLYKLKREKQLLYIYYSFISPKLYSNSYQVVTILPVLDSDSPELSIVNTVCLSTKFWAEKITKENQRDPWNSLVSDVILILQNIIV